MSADLNNTKNRHSGSISVDSTILFFGLLHVCSDPTAIDRGLKLVLRGPEFLRDGLKALLEAQGVNVSALMQNEPNVPVSQLEVKELLEPYLKKSAEMSTLAQIADRYLFEKDPTAENVVYAFYIGARYMLVRERKPTKTEGRRIWEIALWIAQNSRIGASHWKELEDKGQLHLDDWLGTMKENARKRFETFLKHKERASLASNKSLNSLLEAVFDLPKSQA